MVKRSVERFIPRKLTNTLIQKILAIPKIKSEMEHFLNEEIISIHKTETNWKIHSLAKKWQALMINKTFDLFSGICKMIETDSKFKLPWTAKEVQMAIASTKKLLGNE